MSKFRVLSILFCMILTHIVHGQIVREDFILPTVGSSISLALPFRFYKTTENISLTDSFPAPRSVCGDWSVISTIWHFDTFKLKVDIVYDGIAYHHDTVRKFPLPPGRTVRKFYEFDFIGAVPVALKSLNEAGYTKLVPAAYFNADNSISEAQLDSVDFALNELFVKRLNGISFSWRIKDFYYPIDKTDSSALRILLRTQRKGNFRIRSDSVFVYQQLYDPGSMPLDSIAAMQIDQCCYGTDIWAWKQLDKLLADAFQDIVIKKDLNSFPVYRDKMAAIAAECPSERVQAVYQYCLSQLQITYRIMRDFGEW